MQEYSIISENIDQLRAFATEKLKQQGVLDTDPYVENGRLRVTYSNDTANLYFTKEPTE